MVRVLLLLGETLSTELVLVTVLSSLASLAEDASEEYLFLILYNGRQ
jgi:hypothetical protein